MRRVRMTNADVLAEARRLGVRITQGKGDHINLHLPGQRVVVIRGGHPRDIAPPRARKFLAACRNSGSAV